ncbi:hypothetical protein BDP55DRAFT_625760 [Colletotrichum godetiae]|uniref:Zn(2)-C6 fungal-type domain-containing protein n=1 Tax=Colletotrichum godetiae TaxID=1209918 RepID=A0AAJ0F5L8_9PEZI|nr:uncharacterized protein BDP55DRAFT_625760 [Colletotrichum godetiae]KAK1701552.1 hypothetical protein BDP55DRAFT_625760 [Colletotrichum godetiae]
MMGELGQEQQDKYVDGPQSHTGMRANQRRNRNAPVLDNTGQHRTACFTCRAARQKCDRQTPCSRCAVQGHTCRYPLRSNRGRKEGSTNKPDTVQKLLDRINESPVRDQVIAAIINSSKVQSHPNVSALDSFSSLRDSVPAQSDAPGAGETPCPAVVEQSEESDRDGPPDSTLSPCPCSNLRKESSVVSPLHIMAAAFTTKDTNSANQIIDTVVPHLPFDAVGRRGNESSINKRLMEYFTPRLTHDTDWQVLASQPINSTLKLEITACDPETARLADQDDVSLYFQLFFQTRNPHLGLLDPDLHTPKYVRYASFTLFSVICALGCAISTRPRDRILYPTLLSLAEANLAWSIAVPVRSLETIQAIIAMKYWAPMYQRQGDDPHWLHISHAVQLAKELRINKPATITELVKALSTDKTIEMRERFSRNLERTRLYVFIADKSFGIVMGRSPSVAWKELPPCPCQWWRKSMTTPLDRMISGIIEIRVQLLESLKQLERTKKTAASVSNWHINNYKVLDRTCKISKAFETARQLLDLVLHDRTVIDVGLGWHNNQFVMVAHAMTEIVQAMNRGNLSPTDHGVAASQIRATSTWLEAKAQALPATSIASLYSDLSRVLVYGLDEETSTDTQRRQGRTSNEIPDCFMTDWSRAVDAASLNPMDWLDMSFLGNEDSLAGLENINFNDLGDDGALRFP